MNIKFKSLSHETIEIIADPTDTISIIKEKIADQIFGLHGMDIKYIIFNQQSLNDDETISFYGINESSVPVVVILQEGESIQDIIPPHELNSEYDSQQEQQEQQEQEGQEQGPANDIDENNPFSVITEDDNRAIDEFVAMGFDRTRVIHNYFSCGKNAELVLDILLNGTD